MDVMRLKARLDALRADRSSIEGEWDKIFRFVMPAEPRIGETRPKLDTDVDVWDLTAPLACEHLASSLHGNVTSPSGRWVDFEFADQELENDQEARVYRERLAELVWAELQSSDFNMEIASGYHEFVGIGNMVLLVEAAHPTLWEGLDFTAVPCREVFFEEDSRGGLKTFFRLLRWTPVQILDRFGEKGTPEWIKERAKQPDGGTARLDVVFCIYRREEVPLETDGPLVPPKRPFGAIYFPLEKPELLGEEEGGYYEMPVVHVPWARVPGSVWGFGRGNLALRSTKWVNAFKESAREAADKAANPPSVGTERGVLSPPELEAGGYTTVSNPDDLKYLPIPARFDVSAEVLRDERAEIRRCFHEDDLQLKESPQMTAAEVQARLDLMDRVLGSPVGRLQTGGLVPIVKIALGHLSRAKRLPEAPPSVRAKKAELKVKFRGRLARAQLMDEVVGIEREAAFVASLISMGFEEARFHFDVGQAIREHAKRVGAPASTLRSVEAAKRLEAEARAAVARQAGAEAAKKEGEAMRAMAQAQAAAAPAGGAPLSISPQPALAPSGGIVA